MFLTETGTIAGSALPLAPFRDHLRLGRGFSDDAVQDSLLESQLRAALAAIEARTAKALIARDFRLELPCWRDPSAQALPLAPIAAISAITLVDGGGGESLLDPALWRLEPDLHRPLIRPRSTGLLPDPPEGGAIVIAFRAGFGDDFTALPPDLGQAVLMLAAQYHEARHEGGAEHGAMPFGVAALIERWRRVRILGGGTGRGTGYGAGRGGPR